jgi:hypothetical protein
MIVLALVSMTILYHMGDNTVQRYKALESIGATAKGVVTAVTTSKSETYLHYSFDVQGDAYTKYQAFRQGDILPVNSPVIVRYLVSDPSQNLAIVGDPVASARSYRDFFKYVAMFLVPAYGLAVVLLYTSQKKRAAQAA